MFKSWSAGDVAAWGSLVVMVIGGIIAGVIHSLHTARRFGHFESEHDGMKTKIDALTVRAEKHDALGTSIALLTQTVGTLQTTMADMRAEGREGRQEMRDAVAELKTETRDALNEIRQDVRNIVTGKVRPARSTP